MILFHNQLHLRRLVLRSLSLAVEQLAGSLATHPLIVTKRAERCALQQWTVFAMTHKALQLLGFTHPQMSYDIAINFVVCAT